jgi:hypothetical protein
MYWKKEIITSFCIITISASNIYMPMIRLYVFLLDFLIPFFCDPDLQCRSPYSTLPVQNRHYPYSTLLYQSRSNTIPTPHYQSRKELSLLHITSPGKALSTPHYQSRSGTIPTPHYQSKKDTIPTPHYQFRSLSLQQILRPLTLPVRHYPYTPQVYSRQSGSLSWDFFSLLQSPEGLSLKKWTLRPSEVPSSEDGIPTLYSALPI